MKSFTIHPKAVLQTAIILLVVFIQINLSPILTAQADGFSLPAQINKSFNPISISAGGTSTLSVSIFNPNSFALILSNTNAWTDDLSALNANLNFANPVNTTTTCGGIVSAVGTTLSLNGGSVPAQVGTTPGSCTVTVQVTSTIAGNHINTIPASILNATDPTGTIPVTNTTPASATLQVNTVQPPSLSKSFAPNTIWVGENSTLTITLRNNDSNTALTQVSITDALPSNVSVASFAPSQCGGGTVTGTTNSISLSGGSIAKSGTCTITVTVTSNTPGIYINTIPASAIHDQQGVTNASAASAPLNVQSVGIIKSFFPSAFQSGGISTLTITLQNPSSTAYTGATFTDTLPSGLIIATPPNASTTCTPFTTLTASAGTQIISLSDGVIPSGSSLSPGTCTVKVDITSTTPASYTNSIPAGALTTTQGATNILPANANITVYGTGLGVTGSKDFNPDIIPVDGTSRLFINITAPADTQLTHVSLSDALPSGVQVAATPNPANNGNCGGASTFAPSAGATLLTFSNGTILPARTCTLAVNVTASLPGVYTNTISPANISDTENRNVSGNFSADLTVSGLSVSKAFAPTTVNPDGISTLTITLTNTNTRQLDNVSLTETLPGTLSNGVVIAPVPPSPSPSTTCTGGSVTATPGTQAISMSSGIIPAQVGAVPGICTIVLDVIGKGIAHTYTNRIPIGNVTGTIHGTSIQVSNPREASADLTIQPITIGVVKGFDPLTVFAGSTSTLTVQLSNPNNVALAGIAFTDNLPQGTGGGMSIANPPNLNVGTCGGSITAAVGATSFSFSGGNLAASASCSLTLSVTMNVEANLTNTIGIGAVTSTNGARNTQAASASLTNLPGVSISKVFGPNPISAGAGNSSTITFTIQNTGNVALTHLGFNDTFPAGMTATTFNASQCGGVVSWDGGTKILSLTNGALAASSTCTITVDVTAPAPQSYQNCVPANGVTDTQGATNSTAACDTLTVIGPPTISKAFSPATIVAGTTSALTFTLTNPAGNTVSLTDVAFTDTFPGGMTLASVPNVSQCGGTVSSTAGSITLTGGTLPVNGSCTVTASVTAAAGGTYPNTSGAVSSTNGGTGNTATDTLTVIEPPHIDKGFALPKTIAVGGTSTLTFTLTNPTANTVALDGVAFSDTYPFGLSNATPPATTNTCGGTLTATAGDDTISLTGASIPINSTCTITVDVTASIGGNLVNTTSAVTSTNGGTGNTATDTLTVTGGGLSLVKSTTTVGYQASGDTINYSYLLTNTGDVDLHPPYIVTDDTASGVSCPSIPDPLIPGGTVTCNVIYTVQAADITAQLVTNTATATARDAGGGGGNLVTSNQSSVTVHLESLTLTKSTPTASYRNAGDTIDYSYTLTNTGGVTLYAPFNVGDDHIGSPLGTPFSCGAVTSLAPGANVSCTSSYTVTGGPGGDVENGSVTNHATGTAKDAASGGNTVTSNPDSVTVYALTAPTISKTFSPDSIAVGATSLLTFTITNPSPNAIPLTGVAFTDNFPAGVTVAFDPDAAQCGGSVSNSNTSITLTGGTIVPNSSCTVTVSVTGLTSGIKNNTSGQVKSTNGGNGNTASATLTVTAPPTITKSFSPGTVIQGGTSTLTFTLTNPTGNTGALTGVGFTDNLPAGVTVASSGPISVCGGSQTTTSPDAISFSGGTIAVGGTCTLTVTVTAASSGTFDNTTGAVTSTEGGTGATSNTATLIANEAVDLSITKSDGKLVVNRGDVLTYAIVVSNAGPSAATGATVSDTIPSSLTGATWTCVAGTGATCTASGSGNISDTVNIPAGGNVTYSLHATVSNTLTTDVINNAAVIPPVTLTDTDLSNNSATDIDKINILTIAKSPNPTTYSTVGTTINYSYTITNSGTSTLVNPFTVTDDKIPALNCSAVPASLAPTEFFTCTASYVTTQADLDAGSIVNNVFATAKDVNSDAVTSNTATVTVNAIQTRRLTLAKSITSVGPHNPYSAVGDVISYSYLLTNSGNVTLTGNGAGGLFTVTDDHIGSPVNTPFTCGAATSLAPGASVSCTSSYTIVQTDLDNGSVTNRARGHGRFGATAVTSNLASQTATGAQTLSLTLVKSITSGSPFNAAGNVVNYSYVLTNSGNVTLTGIGGGVFTVSDNKATVTCPPAPTRLAPGASVTCTASHTITQAEMDFGSVTNLANGHAITLVGSTPVLSNQDTQTATGIRSPSLKLVKSITSGNPFNSAGNTINYSYVLTNTGNVTLTGNGAGGVFTISDDLATVACPPATTSLAPAAAVTCTASYTVTQADMDFGNVTNFATGHSLFGITPIDSNQDTQIANGNQNKSLTLVKGTTSGDPFNAAGNVVNYSYVLTNSGNVTLTGIGGGVFTVSDNKATVTCPPAPTSLAPTATVTCTASYTITQADMDSGSVTNHATGHAVFNASPVDSNQATHTATGNQDKSLTLVKSITSGSPFNAAGNVVNYSYVLTNSGNVTLTGIGGGVFTVSDDKATVTCPPAPTSLAPAATITCTASHTITQAEMDFGSVTNLANGHAITLVGSTPVLSNQDTQTATGIQSPSLSLVKSITSGNPYSKVNDVVSYSYLLTNTGNVTLTGIGGGAFTVSDDKATVTCPNPPASLAPLATVTCTGSYTIQAADLGSSVTNHATGHAMFKATPVDSNQDSKTAMGAPVLNITKSDGLDIIAPEAQTEYTINVTNASLQGSTGIQLVDTIPTGTSFVSATGGGTFNSGTGKVTWPNFDLAAGASAQFKVTVKVNTAAQLAGPPAITFLTNKVDVQDDGTHSAGIPVSASATDTDQIAINSVKTLTGTEQSGSADPSVLIGEILDYRIHIDIPVGNIRDLKAVDILDRGLAFVGCGPAPAISTTGALSITNDPCVNPNVEPEPVTDTDPTNAGRHITLDFGPVQNNTGSTQTLTVNYRVIVLDIKDNVNGVTGLKNSVEWIWEGGTLAGAASGVNVIEPQLAIVKTVDPAITSLGSIVTFTIKINHTSNSTAPAYDALMTDGIPTGMVLDQTSIVVTPSAGLTAVPTITTSPTQFSVSWSAFPLGESATITFKATFIGPSPVVNTANVEWSSIQIDPAPHLQPLSTYNQFSTERRYDPLNQAINDYRATSSATLAVPRYPRTGFAPGQITLLPEQPEDEAYQALGNLWLEIPRLGVKISIVGIPLGTDGDWDLTWLSDQAGYLDGTAYPTHAGNSVLTGHVYLADGSPGPFVNLHTLQYGDPIIVHLAGQRYIYQVRSDNVTSPSDNSAFQHEIYPWLTLITCKDYDAATNTYTHRVTVRAVLIKIETDAPSSGGGGGR